MCVSHVIGRQNVYVTCGNTYSWIFFHLACSRVYGGYGDRGYMSNVIGWQSVCAACNRAAECTHYIRQYLFMNIFSFGMLRSLR